MCGVLVEKSKKILYGAERMKQQLYRFCYYLKQNVKDVKGCFILARLKVRSGYLVTFFKTLSRRYQEAHTLAAKTQQLKSTRQRLGSLRE